MPNVNQARVKEVLDQVGLLEFVQSQKNGLSSNLGYVEDDGVMLSGGQMQRLAIARALYQPTALLILDEPTSAIDAKSEQEIIDSLFDTYQSAGVIIVSHRLSTVVRADQIIVMKGGKIAEVGTHNQLYRRETSYYELFHKQAEAILKKAGNQKHR